MSIFLNGQFTVYFEDPFWVGMFERIEEGSLQVCKVTFGQEPKIGELYEFVLSRYRSLCFTMPMSTERHIDKRINPKRLQREIKQSTQTVGVRTKAQEAYQAQLELQKMDRKQRSRENRERELHERYVMKVEKRKQKKRGH